VVPRSFKRDVWLEAEVERDLEPSRLSASASESLELSLELRDASLGNALPFFGSAARLLDCRKELAPLRVTSEAEARWVRGLVDPSGRDHEGEAEHESKSESGRPSFTNASGARHFFGRAASKYTN